MGNLNRLFLLLFLFSSTGSYTFGQHATPDTALTTANEVTGLHINRQSLAEFLDQQILPSHKATNIREFYENRNYQFAWFNEEGLAEQTQALWSLYENFLQYSGDSSLYNADLHEHMEDFMTSENAFGPNLPDIASTELKLTQLFLNFVEHAYAGKADPKALQWNIPRKKVSALQILDDFEDNPEEREGMFSVSPQYQLMKEKVLRFKELQNTQWQDISLGKRNVYKLGDSASEIHAIKERLYNLGDLPSLNGSNSYDSVFRAAVINFQKRHGLAEDGIVGPAFIKTINIPIEKKIEKVLINMERMRWMPETSNLGKVIVNIPEFRLYVYEGSEEVLSMDIVVGKTANRTVIFSDQIKNVVFSPYWNIPRSIIRNEILPGIEENPRYLAVHNMEIIGERNGLPIIRQRPGRKNALGRVKFIFPNRYSIYLHDTPSKGLFERRKRAFSHGCIRVSQPVELAKYLLSSQTYWTEKKIRKAMRTNTEKWVKLDDPVPVFISYFTAWVDQNGQLNFRDDIYGHDKKLAMHLF